MIPLQPGEKALCSRCDSVLAQGSRLGAHGTLVFSLTTLALAIPAMTLPFISAGKFGEERVSRLFTGVGSLWNNGMRGVAVLVFLLGGLLPLLLAALLATVEISRRLRRSWVGFDYAFRLARALEPWAIPEVQVLAVFVALIKLGSLVTVTIGLGCWCYCAMTVCLLVTQRSFDFDAAGLLAANHEPEHGLSS